MPGPVPSFVVNYHLNPVRVLSSRYYYPCFTGKETEAQKEKSLAKVTQLEGRRVGVDTSPPGSGAPCAILSWGSVMLDRHQDGGRDGWAPLGQPDGLRACHARTLCFLGGCRTCREISGYRRVKMGMGAADFEASARLSQGSWEGENTSLETDSL